MDVAIGSHIVSGPWGGGNRFASALADAIRRYGGTARFDLSGEPDIILLTDPRPRNPGATFTAREIFRKLAFSKSSSIVIHRINECDERKNTRSMNFRLRTANYTADHTVFVGRWLEDLDVWRRENGHSVILNGADSSIFHSDGFEPWSGNGPLRLVTHHWGAHWMKGFDVYRLIDDLLDSSEWRARIGFTFIGNLPDDFIFRNARHIPPLDGEALARELKRHHAYVTASINEPGGNHQNEGAACGMPLLYRKSGCLPEYCQGFGIEFEAEDFVQKLSTFIHEYPRLALVMPDWPHTAERMCGNWLELFSTLLEERDEIVSRRRVWREPITALKTQIPF